MRRLLLHISILLTVFLVSSCRPKGVLSTKEMTDLLFDIHLVESMSDVTYGESSTDWTQGLSKEDFTDLAYQSVLKKHAVTEADFYVSVAYYSKKMRLFTRIYADLDKKLEAYAQTIDTWTESTKTELEVKTMMMNDEARIRALFEYMHIKPDTTSRISYSYRPDSVKAMTIRYMERLLKKPAVLSTDYTMIKQYSAAGTLESATDSIEGVAGDSTKNSDIPTVDVLLKRALPMDELLRLQAAGAYDKLNPKSKPVSQPVSNSDRTKKLKERSSDQR